MKTWSTKVVVDGLLERILLARRVVRGCPMRFPGVMRGVVRDGPLESLSGAREGTRRGGIGRVGRRGRTASEAVLPPRSTQPIVLHGGTASRMS